MKRIWEKPSREAVLITAFLVVTVLSGIVIPVLIVQVRGYPAHSASVRGTPIDGTPFRALVSEVPDPVMLPGGIVNRIALPHGSTNGTNDTIVVTANHSPSVRVNLAQAVDMAQEFISTVAYLAGRTFAPDFNTTIYDIYKEAVWRPILSDSQIRLTVSVNAVSGRITGLNALWLSPLANPFRKVFNTTTALDEGQVVEKAIEFLQKMNYTLSPHTRVIGPIVESSSLYLSTDAYVIRLVNVIDNVFVQDNEISLVLDVESGTVYSFSYHWTFIPDFSTEDVIGASHAESLALRYMSQTLDGASVSVAWSSLILLHYFPANGSAYELQWVVTVSGSGKFTVFVYPLSGMVHLLPSLLAMYDVYLSPTEVGPIQAASGLVLALATGSLFFVVLRRRVLVHANDDSLAADEKTESGHMQSNDD